VHLRPGRVVLVLLLVGSALVGATHRASIPVVVNFDPRGYAAVSNAGPAAVHSSLSIPAARLCGQEMCPGIMAAWPRVGFICAPGGWRKLEGAGAILWGKVLGGSAPAADWMPPYPCPKEGLADQLPQSLPVTPLPRARRRAATSGAYQLLEYEEAKL
jgi:hypothetical protein